MLWLVRHGETSLGEDDSQPRLRGNLPVRLSPEGRSQIVAAGNKLANRGIHGIITDDMPRTLESAHILSKQTGSPILAVSPRLKTWDIGALSGQYEKAARPILKSLMSLPNIPAPNGESYGQFTQRWGDILPHLLDASRTSNLAVATHGNNLLLTKAHLDQHQPRYEDQHLIDHGEIMQISSTPDGQFTHTKI